MYIYNYLKKNLNKKTKLMYRESAQKEKNSSQIIIEYKIISVCMLYADHLPLGTVKTKYFKFII